MKKTVFVFLYSLFLFLWGCDEPPANMEFYYNQPAIVTYSYNLQFMIETQAGTFFAPELAYLSEPLYEGDLLWTSFDVDLNNQPYSDRKTASNLYYKRIFSTNATPLFDGSTYYDDPINLMLADVVIIRNLIFFWFSHDDVSVEQEYEYLMMYDEPEDGIEVPTLYIRARKSNNPTSYGNGVITCYGFDLSRFLDVYLAQNPASNEVLFNVVYLNGISNGEDEYRQLNNGFYFRWVVND